MQLDPVETGAHCTPCGIDELLDDTGKLRGLKGARCLEGLHALLGVDLAGGRDGRGGDRLLAGDRLVADPARLRVSGAITRRLASSMPPS